MLPLLVPVTNVGLVVVVTLSDAAPQVTENNPLPALSNKICQGIKSLYCHTLPCYTSFSLRGDSRMSQS